MRKRSTSFYLTEEAHNLLRRLADEQNTSMNKIVETAVRAMVEQEEADEPEERTELLEAMRDQVEFLRRESERKDAIIMSLTQRVPELEAAPIPSEKSTAEHERTPWWKRMMGG